MSASYETEESQKHQQDGVFSVTRCHLALSHLRSRMLRCEGALVLEQLERRRSSRPIPHVSASYETEQSQKHQQDGVLSVTRCHLALSHLRSRMLRFGGAHLEELECS